jgi:hypothetical protein
LNRSQLQNPVFSTLLNPLHDVSGNGPKHKLLLELVKLDGLRVLHLVNFLLNLVDALERILIVNNLLETSNLSVRQTVQQPMQVLLVHGQVFYYVSQLCPRFDLDAVCLVSFGPVYQLYHHVYEVGHRTQHLPVSVCVFVAGQHYRVYGLDVFKADVHVWVVDSSCIYHSQNALNIASQSDVVSEQKRNVILQVGDLLLELNPRVVSISVGFENCIEVEKFLNDLLEVNVDQINLSHAIKAVDKVLSQPECLLVDLKLGSDKTGHHSYLLHVLHTQVDLHCQECFPAVLQHE